MSKRKVLTLWDETGINEKDTSVLRKKSSEVPAPIDKESKTAVQTLIESFLARDDASGLAAPQIGIGKKIAVIDVSNGENPADKLVIINPKIVRARAKTQLTLKAQSDLLRQWVYIDGLTGVRLGQFRPLGDVVHEL